jgi:hypothetical protein
MSFEVGTHLYRYTVKNNKFYVHEGIVNQCIDRKVVVFPDGGFHHGSVKCPRPEDIGVVRNNGFFIWLTERNDKLAKQRFINYEIYQIHRMDKLIDEKVKIVKMLHESMNIEDEEED